MKKTFGNPYDFLFFFNKSAYSIKKPSGNLNLSRSVVRQTSLTKAYQKHNVKTKIKV
jgi:hypothetical protein